MEKIINIAKNNKYFWFYPKSRNNIKTIINSNSKSKSKSIIRNKINKNIDLILIQIKYKKNTSKLFPENIFIHLTFYKIKNKRIYFLKNKLPGIVFFKNSFINKNNFKMSYLKNIVKKFYFDNIQTDIFKFKFYSNL